MVDDTQSVPRYFSEFVKQNADEHGRLAAEIAATRGELREEISTLRGDLGTTSGGLREEMATLRGELREDMATLRGDIARAEARFTRWTVGTILGGLAVAVAVLAYVN